jgi:CelD/BcsL family acetyltransferase involved in cellulose biosynthesis
VVEIADSVAVQRVSTRRQAGRDLPASAAVHGGAAAPLAAVSAEHWRALASRAIEPNGYYLPDWEFAVDASARNRMGASALTAWNVGITAEPAPAQMVGLIPVISLRRAYGIPLPAFVTADPYGTLGTPLLDRTTATDAVDQIMQQARDAGAHALILRDMSLDGPAMQAFTRVLTARGFAPTILQSHVRACLDATRDGEEVLRDALGAKKLKELRRQRNRLAEHGDVSFNVASAPAEVAAALEIFLTLESSGWKARRGTALNQHAGDEAFIRRATAALAARGQCQIVSLRAGPTPVAAAIVLRHQDRAFYFKLGVDERFAKLSPGVQLTLDLTRHLCADPAIATVDSTASAGHPMIDPIWRGRLAIGDVLIPLKRHDPVVALIHAAMTLRRWVREPARRAVHAIRKRQEKTS